MGRLHDLPMVNFHYTIKHEISQLLRKEKEREYKKFTICSRGRGQREAYKRKNL